MARLLMSMSIETVHPSDRRLTCPVADCTMGNSIEQAPRTNLRGQVGRFHYMWTCSLTGPPQFPNHPCRPVEI